MRFRLKRSRRDVGARPGVFRGERPLLIGSALPGPTLRRDASPDAWRRALRQRGARRLRAAEACDRVRRGSLDETPAQCGANYANLIARVRRLIGRRRRAPALRAEWEYVNGSSRPLERLHAAAARRDEPRLDGDDRAEVNSFIRGRPCRGRSAGGSARTMLLTRDEVLAIRLYSGPAYQPINDFCDRSPN